MRAKLQVQAGDPANPEQAARAVTRELLTTLPRARPVTLGLHCLGPHAGLTPTPWVLSGVLQAILEAERGTVFVLVTGDEATADAALRRAANTLSGHDLDDLVRHPARDRIVRVRPRGHDGTDGALKVPREIVGTSLVTVAPLVLERSTRQSGPTWLGPAALACASVAERLGPPARSTSPRPLKSLRALKARATASPDILGHAALTEVFASTAVILDATWAGALARSAGDTREASLDGELASAERVLGVPDFDRLDAAGRLALDAWLAHHLGLERSPSRDTKHRPEFSESPGRWPSLSLATGAAGKRRGPAALADRAIAGIRSQGQRLARRSTRALPARVPGRFATLWTQRWYREGRVR